MGDPEEPELMHAQLVEPFYLATAQHRAAIGHVDNCPALLFELCVKSLLQHLKKFDSLAADPVLSSRKNQQLLQNLPSTVVQRIFALSAVVLDYEDKLPSLWMILVFVSRNTDHLDFYKLPLRPNVEDHFVEKTQPVIDLLSELRFKGVDKLKTLLVPYEWRISQRIVRAEHLVPNERLVHLQMVQMTCSDKDLAVLSIKFPNLQDVEVGFSGRVSRSGIDHLSKLQKLHSFHFCIGDSMTHLADDLLVIILQSLPGLRRAGRCEGSKDALINMSKALNACSKPLRLTHVYVDIFYFNKNLSQLLPELTSLKVRLVEGVQNYCGLTKLRDLYFVYIGQENFDSMMNLYGKKLKKLRVLHELNLDSAARLCSNLESLECGLECTLSDELSENPWPLLTEFTGRRRHLEIDLATRPNSLKFKSVCLVERLSFLNPYLSDLPRMLEEFEGRFDNLVEATLCAEEFDVARVRKFLTLCPKLAKLSLSQEMYEGGYLERQMFKIPGLHMMQSYKYL